jgi:hypothetical protein
MAGHGCPPQHKTREHSYSTGERPLNPYMYFVGAFLRQVVADALGPNEDTDSVQLEAQEFLLDLNRLALWVELTGADVTKMQGVLLRAAGLVRTPPG